MTIDFSPDATRFQNITEEMCETFSRKNADYGNSFEESIDEFGFVAGVVMLKHKVNRAKTLLVNQEPAQVKEESVIDTLTDLANYAILMRMALEKRMTKGPADTKSAIVSDLNNHL